MNTKAHGTTSPSIIALGIGILALLYPLSIGPVSWIDRHRLLPRGVIDCILTAYYPLDICYSWSPQFRNVFDWYIALWV